MQQHVSEIGICELKVTFIVKFEQSGTVRVFVLEVEVVDLRLVGGMTTLFTHVHLGPPLFVGILVLHAMHLEAMRFKRTPLRERLFAKTAFVWPNTCNNIFSCMNWTLRNT